MNLCIFCINPTMLRDYTARLKKKRKTFKKYALSISFMDFSFTLRKNVSFRLHREKRFIRFLYNINPTHTL